MKLILSELFALVDLKASELLKTSITGVICIVAIKECGALAVGAITALAFMKIVLAAAKDN